jgi:hypothetical protein
MCFGGGGGDGGAAQARADEEKRQARIRAGMGAIQQGFGGFDETFYDNRAKAYLRYANPQLASQYDNAQDNLAYNLARAGLTASSESARNAGELQRQYNVARSDVQGRALDTANEARRNVEANRAELIAQLQATSDPTATANQALARAATLTKESGFSPLGALFQNSTALLGNTGMLGYKQSPLNTTRYGQSSGASSQIVR